MVLITISKYDDDADTDSELNDDDGDHYQQ